MKKLESQPGAARVICLPLKSCLLWAHVDATAGVSANITGILRLTHAPIQPLPGMAKMLLRSLSSPVESTWPIPAG